ncbi:MAG: DNA polymerase III subunit alpha [Flavobacteriales bacterium]
MFLIYDTETTGFPRGKNPSHTDLEAYDSARMVQLAWQLHDFSGKLINRGNYLIKPDGFEIPYSAAKIHGITQERAMRDGVPVLEALEAFAADLARSTYNVGHNISFDLGIVGSEYHRAGLESNLWNIGVIDTKDVSTEYCAIPGGKGGKFKWPTLTELHVKLFGHAFDAAHDAAYDVDATARCFFGLITNRVHVPSEVVDVDAVVYEAPELEAANFEAETETVDATIGGAVDTEALAAVADAPFVHLHCHSQFSILQAFSTTDALIGAAVDMNMPAIALTDHGNMMGAYQFVENALKKDITPIMGCEFNVCKDRLDKSYKDDGYQTVILAKNKKGYNNLCKLASSAYTEGFYYVPRIDKNILLEYKEDLIVLSGGLWGEVPNAVLNQGESKAEEALLWWKEHFGDDFYVEINRHGLEEEDVVNAALLRMCRAHGVKYVAANNTYYTTKSEAEAHDVLLCVRDAESVNKPKRYFGKRGREFRYGFPNDSFYIKSPDEMKALFADLPEAILTVGEVLDKIETYRLAHDVLLPAFDIPEQFQHAEDAEDGGKRGENAYLKHITYEGAKVRYGEIAPDIAERLDFELDTIANTGYPGYFLIVHDFCNEARNMGVSVGPGRGSAAGSAVAYCLGITNIDPIKYDLLFERFLNPERVSLPDIDIDFDDEGRDRVIKYVIDKYGENQVAQIITYGTMAAKSSIRDTGRVLELPLPDTDRIAKLLPDIKLRKLFGLDEEDLKAKLSHEDLEKAHQLKELAQQTGLEADTVNKARMIEGALRNTGIHACGVIITPEDITNLVPVAVAKDSSMWCTQFDNSVVENAGLLKMDFLGLKTLTLIKDAVRYVKAGHDVDLDPEHFPLDDEKTYELFQRGETVGIFQYESPGMQKHLKALKPTVFADLIAMNALYRPGPMEYIPSFVKRKHGIEEIEYDLDDCKEYLEETYGITVYQEQVMLLSQKLANFSKGQADMLRKGMGKKKKDIIDALYPKFVDGCVENGHDKKTVDKIWKDWEAFASYAFNKSHSTCYAWVAYQTAYLKAHYPAEYMASVLSNNMGNIESVTFFMEECRRMGIPVLGPDVNESGVRFRVNKEGAIRFGLAAIKGVGRAAVESLIEERQANGSFSSIFDLVERVDLRALNKKNLENLAFGGAFDGFGNMHRAQYFAPSIKEQPFLDTAVKFGNAMKNSESSNQQSLFGGDMAVEIPTPPIPTCEPWTNLEQLAREKEVVGMYISGHPLDDFKLELRSFCSKGGLSLLKDLPTVNNRDLQFGGIVTEAVHRMTKNGRPFGMLTLEDYNHAERFFLFGEDYVRLKEYLNTGWFLYVTGRVGTRKFSKDPNELEFKISDISLLNEVREKKAKRLHLDVDLPMLTEELTTELEQALTSHKGAFSLRVHIKHKNTKLTMPSQSLMVDMSNELLDTLEKLHGVEVRVE